MCEVNLFKECYTIKVPEEILIADPGYLKAAKANQELLDLYMNLVAFWHNEQGLCHHAKLVLSAYSSIHAGTKPEYEGGIILLPSDDELIQEVDHDIAVNYPLGSDSKQFLITCNERGFIVNMDDSGPYGWRTTYKDYAGTAITFNFGSMYSEDDVRCILSKVFDCPDILTANQG